MKPQRVQVAGRISPANLIAPQGLVPRGRLACVREQNLLFSSWQGAVFTLNDTAADIWRSLEEGVSVKAISDAMIAGGAARQEADGYIEAALHDWERLGLIQPAAPLCPDVNHLSQIVAVSGLRVRILYPKAAAPAASIFRHLEPATKTSEVLLQLFERGERVHLFRDGVWAGSCSSDEIPVLVKGQLLSEFLEHGSYELALHAAALLNRGRTLLLCGNPGAGKTTLALALVRAGLGFMADDVTVLDSAGHAIGLAFAPAVKSGSWPILTEFFPELGKSPVYRRPDGRRVRFLVPRNHVPATPQPVGWVVLLRRTRHAKPSLRLIEPDDILNGLLNGSFARNRELSSTAFDVLCQVIRSAQGFCLTYATLDEAVDLLKAVCR